MMILKRKFLTFLLGIFLISCSSDDDNGTKYIEMEISITNTEIFTFDLGIFANEEGASISRQANHFEISELVREDSNGTISYNYKSEEGYLGSDTVEITSFRDLNGSTFSDFEVTKITFTITE